MIKKIIVSFLMAVFIFCGICIGTTIVFAEDNTGNTAAVSNASKAQIASVSPFGLYPNGSDANVPIKVMEDDDEICTLMIDPGLTFVKGYSTSFSCLRISKGSTVKIVPNKSVSIKKIIVQAQSTYTAGIAVDEKYGQVVDLTDDEKTQLNNPSTLSVKSIELNSEYVATEENPYVFTTSMQFYLQSIHVIYEKQTDGSITYDCTKDKKASPATVKVGDATFLIKYEGMFNNGYPAYGDGSFKITICPVPGYVINYVIFKSSLDNPFDASELKFSELEATYENGDLKVTGMKPGQTYEVYSDGAAKGLLTAITVNYIEHEHSGVYEPGSDETHHFKQCECLWRVDEELHTFGEGEVTLEPTHQRKGKVKYTCTNADCGYEKEEQLAPNLADTEIVLDKELIYNGERLFPIITVKYKGNVVGSSNYKKSGTTYAKEPGDYTLTIEPKDGGIFEGSKEFTYTIKKGSVAKPALDTTAFYFDKTVKTYKVEESEHYTVLDNSNQQTNPGSYKVKIALNNPDYCEWEDGTTDALEYDFVINKGNYDMSSVVFADKTVTYNGTAFSIEATNLPDGLTVEYENNGKTDAGEYVVTAKFAGEEAYAQYYNPIDDLTATLKINRASVNKPTADATEFTYNGQAQTYTLETNNLYTISDATFTNAGTYPITVALNDKTNYEWEDGTNTDLTFSFVIGKASVNKPTADATEFTYNGQAQTYALQANSLYTISTTTFTNAGTYPITVALNDKTNYKWEDGTFEDLTFSFVINKATYDMSAVVFADKTEVYNGSAFSIEATNLPNGVTVAYENNGKTDAGVYTVTAIFTGNANYNAIADMTATLTINKATYDMTGVVFADKTVTYNGTAFSIEATNLPDGVTVAYENNGKTDAGVYTITAKFTGNANYNAIQDMTATLTINKATYDMSGVVFADKTVTYDGNAFSIEATNLPTGVTASYENNGKTEAGEYVVTAKFTGNANYNAIENKTATLTINKATYDMTGVVFADKTVTYNGTAFSIEATNLPDGVTVAYENNGKTDAGEYVVTAKFKGNANYNAIENKTATLTIDKATYDMSGVVFANTAVTYNGTAFSIEATNLPDGVTVAYENNGKTEAGVYTIIAKFTGNENYNAIADMTATLTINKATYNMSIVVFADKAVTYNGSAFSIEATNLPNGVTVAYENNGKTDAGVYTITAKFTGNANYNAIQDMTATLTIDKATYDMSGVVFADKTVTYNGSAFSIEATNLPDGVTVAYENNGKTDAGVYTITAKFTGNANYNAIPDMTATLTIKNVLLTFNTDAENEIADEVIISAPDGIDPTKELVVEEVEDTKNYSELINKNQKVAIAYDIKLLKDGATVQPDGTLQFKVLIPEELRGKDFSIIHIHNDDETSVLEYKIDGDYVVFESNKLSDFVFVYEMGSILWAIIVLSVVALFEVAFLVYLLTKNKQLKSKKLMSAYPPFLFGMFIAEWEIVLVIVLAVVVIALAIVSIIFATKVINNQTKTSAKAEEVVVEEESNDDQPIEEVKNEVDEKDEPVRKSFLERLGSCDPETIEYYNDIKNELLSYKNVKSKISFKHESFRLGMPIIARLKIKKKSLYLCLALDPKQYLDTKYKIKDMSAVGNYKDVPTMYKINLPRRAVYAKEMIQDLMGKFNAEKNND